MTRFFLGNSRSVQNAELERAKEDPSLFFRDGRRRIDMVLAYEEEEEDARAQSRSDS